MKYIYILYRILVDCVPCGGSRLVGMNIGGGGGG